MIIILSVMPPYTYPSLSLASYRAITILYNLQLFVCPMNDNTTRIPSSQASETETSDVSMTMPQSFIILMPSMR
jgi:hypothetical protein